MADPEQDELPLSDADRARLRKIIQDAPVIQDNTPESAFHLDEDIVRVHIEIAVDELEEPPPPRGPGNDLG